MIRDSSPPEAIRASGRSSSPGLGESRNSARSSPRSVHGRRVERRLRVGGREGDLEARLLHRELRRARPGPRLAQLARRRAAPLRERPRPLQVGRGQRARAAPRACAPAPRATAELRRAPRGSARRRPAPPRRVAPYFLFSRSIERQARLDLVEPPGAHLEPLAGSPAGSRARSSSGGSAVGPGLEERPELGVDRGQLLDAAEDLAEARRAPPPRRRRAGRRPRRSARRAAPALAWRAFSTRSASSSPGARPGALDLARLELEHLAAPLGLAPVPAQPLEGGLGRAQLAVELAERPAVASTGEVVEQRRGGAAGSSRPCGSCWPWTTASRGARSRSRLTGTSAPLTVARPLPLAWSSRRRTTSSPSRGRPCSSSSAAASASSKTASTDRPLLARADEVGRGPVARAAGPGRRSGSTSRRRFRRSGA